MIEKKMPPIHPGEILREEFLVPMKLSQYRLAKGIGVSPRRINEIVHETRGISVDTALRLGKFFGMTPEFWMNLQARFELEDQRVKLATKLEMVSVFGVEYGLISPTIRNSPNSVLGERNTRRANGGGTQNLRGANATRQASARRAPKHR